MLDQRWTLLLKTRARGIREKKPSKQRRNETKGYWMGPEPQSILLI